MTVIPELHPILRAWLLEGLLSAQVPAMSIGWSAAGMPPRRAGAA
jgi:hypothetical protein